MIIELFNYILLQRHLTKFEKFFVNYLTKKFPKLPHRARVYFDFANFIELYCVFWLQKVF